MKDNNRAFQEMFKAAKTMLEGRSPADIAEKSGVVFDGSEFHISSMGKIYRFSYPDYICRAPLHDWHYLTVLHYLNMADGFPVTGEPISIGDMPGGMIRGTKYDHTISLALVDFFENKSPELIRSIISGLGGVFLSGKADLNVQLPYLPRFPLYLNIWFADEDFPLSAKLLADRCAAHYLTVEDTVTVGEVVLDLLKKTALTAVV